MQNADAYPFRAAPATTTMMPAPPPEGHGSRDGSPSWVWMLVAFFVLLGMWMDVTNTSHMRRMSIVKAQLRTQVHTLVRALRWPATSRTPSPELCHHIEAIAAASSDHLFLMDQEGQVWADAANPRQSAETGPRPSVLHVEQQEERVPKPIEKLVQIALQGGGFHTHPWHDAASQEMKPRLTYVIHVPGTDCILGCGRFV